MFIVLFICFLSGILLHLVPLISLCIIAMMYKVIRKYKFLIVVVFIGYSYVLLFHSHPIDTIQGKVVTSYEYGCIIKADSHYYFAYSDEQYDLGTMIEGKVKCVKEDKTGNFNAFDYNRYLMGKKVFDMIEFEDVHIVPAKSIKQKIIDYLNTFEAPVNSYSKQLLLGIKDEYSSDLYSLTSTLSLLHLFALSGMHLSILEKWLKKLHVPDCVIHLLLGGYVVLVGDSISLWRSYLQKLISHYTKLDELNTISLVGLILLLYNPYLVYNTSFIYSMVIITILTISSKLKYSFVYPYLGSIPLILYNSYSLPIFGLFYSYLCADLVEIIFTVLISNAFMHGFLNPACVYMLKVFENILYYLNSYNLTLIFRKPSIWFVLLYFYLLYQLIQYLQINQVKKKYFISIIGLLIVCYGSCYLDPTSEVTMIDVGQGDCFLVRYPYNQGNVLIDTGGSIYSDYATKRIIPYLKSIGIKKLDYVVITHDDYDHNGALESLVDNYQVDETITKGKDFLDFQYIPIITEPGCDENDQSLVYYLDFGYKYLFTGDLPLEYEKQIFEQIDDIDILKVGHHGSNTSTSAYLLEHLSPSMALISVGKNNKFGHPTHEVLDLLDAYHVKVYRSDLNGMVRIHRIGKRHWIDCKNR